MFDELLDFIVFTIQVTEFTEYIIGNFLKLRRIFQYLFGSFNVFIQIGSFIIILPSAI